MLVFLMIAAIPFGNAFRIDTSYTLPPSIQVSGEHGWSEWSFCTVAPEGDRIALIVPTRHEVVTYELNSGHQSVAVKHTAGAALASHESGEALEGFDWQTFVKTVARQGRNPDQVNIPVAVAFDRSGRLMVSDAGNRRLSMFARHGDVVSSFLFGADEDVPSTMRLASHGNILCANLRLDRKQRLNAGHHCNLYTPSGNHLLALAYTPSIAFERNLWVGVAATFDVDTAGTIFQTFTCDPTVHVYDQSGREVRSFGASPTWFVGPPVLSPPIFELESPPPSYWTAWTRPIGITCIDQDRVLRTSLSNGKVPGVSAPFIIDVFTKDGELVAEGVPSDAWPIGVDRDGAIYFLTLKGDRLLKTHVRERIVP
ncbi:MAG TPA: hypothetical protein VNN55_11260 [bacterium]|nr:hypothetical protein [bacterium]